LVFSDSYAKADISKIILKPISIKSEELIQFESFKDNKAYHENLNISKSLEKIEDLLDNFKQILIITEGKTYQILQNKTFFNLKQINNNETLKETSHNKEKNYILRDGVPVDFLIHLKIMGENGKVYKEKYDKFKQINKYLEFIDITIGELKEKNLISDFIKCIDFGCGKSYLTFALHHYLKNLTNLKYQIIGLDLKKDVIDTCNEICKELQCQNLEFIQGDIKDFDKLQNVDMVFSLHACDNATDYAIHKALELNAKAILAVPCCQHEFNHTIPKNKDSDFFNYLAPLGKDGILMEKFASLATDAFRAQSLRLCGYKVQVMEFIDMEHTPKNIIIKGVKAKISREQLVKLYGEMAVYKEFFGIEPVLDGLIRGYYRILE
jgi:trans-aconitate methyltransferase